MTDVLSVPVSRRIRVRGTVQGVGFRPFVYRLAARLGIRGSVRNDAEGVLIEAFGTSHAMDTFIACLTAEAPPLSSVLSLDVKDGAPGGVIPESFVIAESHTGGSAEIDVARDTATCSACLAEMRDPSDRRYGHAFINCTDCGPRYTIMSAVPYDRSATTMAGFAMCPSCRTEYEDPASRRFHAQPICCPSCGPHLMLLDAAGAQLAPAADPLAASVDLLEAGRIVAIKGIGGYHLACRADDGETVARLRQRKQREEKPFALMVRSIEAARRVAVISHHEERLLVSIERPIVLCARRRDPELPIAKEIAPGIPTLGIMLPYAPIHHLLFDRSRFDLLVMTSANRSDEPMVHDDRVARETLAHIADAFLTHDRPILMRTDDSIVRVVASAPLLLRRGRGFVPEPLPAPTDVTGIVGCGGVLKSTVSVGRKRSCYVSQYVGTIENIETLEQLAAIQRHLLGVLGVKPRLFAADLHPDTLSTQIADPGLPLVRVQHHHAHAAACMAENGLTGRTVCVVYDGTGYGDDGTIWGSEILIADYGGYERFGHLAPMLMPGADAAVHHPWRMAMGALFPRWGKDVLGLFPIIPSQERAAVFDLLCGNVSCVRSAGMGRLFDCMSALLGVCRRRSYEGQPAFLLEAIADPTENGVYETPMAIAPDGSTTWQAHDLLHQAMDDLRQGSSVEVIAGRFHASVAAVTARLAARAAEKAKTENVCLSGGCFQNAILLEKTVQRLCDAGLRPWTHRMVPPNDESVSYGQVVIAATTYR